MKAREILHGYHGGRLVPWVPPEPKFAVGAEVYVAPLHPNEPFVEVTVLELRTGGYVLIQFPSGSRVTVSQTVLFTAAVLGDRLGRTA